MRKAVGTNVEDQLKLLGGYLWAGAERCTVKLPPGLAKLATKPWPTESPVAANDWNVVFLTACTPDVASATIIDAFHFSDPSSVAQALMRHASTARATPEPR
jgi:hypothetical protein